MASPVDDSQPALPRPTSVASLKPSKTAQEFRWKYLKGQQMHATQLHQPVQDVDTSLKWKEASVLLCRC